MSTRITFIGTAGENSVLCKHDRTAGGIVLESGEHSFMIDPGPGALIQSGRMKFSMRDAKAIILTSPRLEQSSDCNVIIDSMTACGLDRHGVLVGNMTAKDMPLLEKYKLLLERIIHLEPGKRIGVEDIDMLGLPTKDSAAIGIAFFTKDGVVTYTSNTSYDDALCEHYKGSEVLILNVFNPKGISVPGFLNTEDAIKIINVAKPKVAIITHFGIKMIKAEPIYEAREIQRQTNVQVIAAKDGLTLSLTPYASSVIVK